MTMTRLWNVIAAVAVLLILLLGYVVGVSPALTTASTADDELVTVEAQNQIKTDELDALKALAKDSNKLFADLAAFDDVIPSEHNSPVFAEQMETLAAAAGVQLVSISYVTAVNAVAPEVPVDLDAPTDVDENVATEEAAPEAEVAAPTDSVTPVVSVPGLVSLAVDIKVAGEYGAVGRFLQSVQDNQRAYSVTSVQLELNVDDNVTEMVLIGSVYVLSDNSAPLGSTVTAGEVVN